MGYFIENPPQISKIDTVIKTRDPLYWGNIIYKDLFVTVHFGIRGKRHYVMHSDVNYTVEYIKDIIDSRLDSDNVLIAEHGGRELLYLGIGTKPLYIVSGRPYFPNFIHDRVNTIKYL